MKKTALVLSALIVSLGSAPVHAQRRAESACATPASNRDCAPDPAISNLLKQYPNGGEALAAAVSSMLQNETDPCQAAADARAIARLAARANPEQKAAIASGFVQTLAALGANSPAISNAIRSAALCFDPATAAIYASLQTQLVAQGGTPGSGAGAGGGGGGGGGGGAGGTPIIISPH